MNNNKTQGYPLFFKLLIAFLGITVAISGSLSVVAYIFSKQAIEKQAQEDIARQVAALDDRFRMEYRVNLKRNLRELTSAPLLDDYLSSSEVEKPIIARKIERLFLQMVADFEGYESIYFIDLTGKEKVGVRGKKRVRQLGDVRQRTRHLDRPETPSFREASNRLFKRLEAQVPPEVHIEGPFIDARGETWFLAGMSKLDYDTDGLGGVISIRCSLKPFLDYAGRVEFFGEDLICIGAPNGQILKDSIKDLTVFGPTPKGFQEALALLISEGGTLAIQDLFIVSGQPFVRVAIGVPESLLLANLQPTFRFFSVVFICAVVVVSGVALYLSRYLSTPIVQLVSATTRIAKGDLSSRVEVKTTGEVQMLVESFNQMAGELQKTTEKLQKFSNVVEQTADMVTITDRDGIIEYVNPAFERITGYSAEEVMGETPRIFKSGEHDQMFFKTLWETILSGQVFQNTMINRKKDGALYYLEKVITPIQDDLGRITHFVSTDRDTTRSRKLAEQLRQSQKMEAVGKLAGGIAHDFNSLMTVVIGYSKLLMGRLEEDSLQHNQVEEIWKAGERAALLTKQLLAFSRKQMLQPRELDLDEVVTDLQDLLQRLLGGDIELVATRGARGQVKADPGQLEQVIVNLVVNARDAMPRGGRLEIETADVDLDEVFTSRYENMVPGPYVMLSVQDTGSGMGKETMERIFEPFFTTKEQGKGTGLGLSMVYGVVVQSGGCVTVDSEEGGGTTFRIYLPRLEEVEKEIEEDPSLYDAHM